MRRRGRLHPRGGDNGLSLPDAPIEVKKTQFRQVLRTQLQEALTLMDALRIRWPGEAGREVVPGERREFLGRALTTSTHAGSESIPSGSKQLRSSKVQDGAVGRHVEDRGEQMCAGI